MPLNVVTILVIDDPGYVVYTEIVNGVLICTCDGMLLIVIVGGKDATVIFAV
ncbi:MAG: hypothetical protein QXV17_10035 [Candidatus Micrarchaeaceae archaeon]